jgi:exopolysaccharide biosynthesis polyprenyl glycosylphosphotransferase
MGGRRLLRYASLVADVLAAVGAWVTALWLRSIADRFIAVLPMPIKFDWEIVVIVAAVVIAFYTNGLYEREAYSKRPLHAWAIIRGSALAFVGGAIIVYLFKSDAVDQSRLILALTFLLFVVYAMILRVGVLDGIYRDWIARHRPMSFLIGDSRESDILAERLCELRGFGRVERIAPDALRPNMGEGLAGLLAKVEERYTRSDAVFIDTLSVAPREVFDLTSTALAHGAEVYVLSGLLGPLEGNRLLNLLFQAPVIRVRRSLEQPSSHLTKRAFDVLGSSALLLVASPVVAALAVAIKMTSPGPVFYSQVRVGRFGVPFRFYKFRSMRQGNDAAGHAEYVKAFISGTAQGAAVDEAGHPVYKIVDDPRITRVGRFIRKYSLDEIPQFFNVLKGDMSLVGPRPPLPYEVEEYEKWHMTRLAIPPGVTGMWQVEGRSRVSFDEMILQDLMYAKNMRLLVDIELCLRTVPAAMLGYGGG